MTTLLPTKQRGGKRPGSGRKPKPIEDASHSVLLSLFDDAAERDVIVNMISIARDSGGMGKSQAAIQAASWLWERKYGKVVDRAKSDTTQRIIVEYGADPFGLAPSPSGTDYDDEGSQAV